MSAVRPTQAELFQREAVVQAILDTQARFKDEVARLGRLVVRLTRREARYRSVLKDRFQLTDKELNAIRDGK